MNSDLGAEGYVYKGEGETALNIERGVYAFDIKIDFAAYKHAN